MLPAGRLPKTIRAGLILAALIIISTIIVIWIYNAPAPQQSQEPLTIATGSGEQSSLTLIADEKGFFTKYGLNATIRNYPTGVVAMNDLLAGNADLAYAAEFVGVGTSFRHADLRIITCTAKSDVISLVVRRDRGILQPSDLRGKTIAFPQGTAAEFFLGRYLILNGIDVADVKIRYLNPADLAAALDRGDADAVIIFEPYVYQISRKMGQNVTVWPAQGGQRFYWVAYTREDVIRNRPETIRKYLRALGEAETFLYTDEPAARAIIQRRLNTTDDYMADVWPKIRFELSLDQGLILAMEDEARWMASENMTGGNPRPSYLDMIDQDPMREIRPSAVTVIG
jgi:NitT/TauT family transport system substrate-binding protein